MLFIINLVYSYFKIFGWIIVFFFYISLPHLIFRSIFRTLKLYWSCNCIFLTYSTKTDLFSCFIFCIVSMLREQDYCAFTFRLQIRLYYVFSYEIFFCCNFTQMQPYYITLSIISGENVSKYANLLRKKCILTPSIILGAY